MFPESVDCGSPQALVTAAIVDGQSKSVCWKYGRNFRIGQQRVIASAQFGLTDDVEDPLQDRSLAVVHARRS